MSILESRTLWLSIASTLNDDKEIVYGGKVITEAVDEVIRSRTTGGDCTLNLDRVNEKSNFLGLLRAHAYVACFCPAGDSRKLWTDYGDYNIGFDRERLEEYLAAASLPFSDPMPLIYKREPHRKAVRCFVSQAEEIVAASHNLMEDDCQALNDEFMFRLFLWVLSMKDPSFSDEREWRIVRVNPSQNEVKSRLEGNTNKRYVELSGIPPTVFARVTLGPGIDSNLGGEPIGLFLQRCGLENVEVRYSKVPLGRIDRH